MRAPRCAGVVLLCAWVLWHQTEETDKRSSPWAPVATSDNQGSCAELRTREIRGNRLPAVLFPDKFVAVFDERMVSLRNLTNGYSVTWSYLCLPDTIDPRGPK